MLSVLRRVGSLLWETVQRCMQDRTPMLAAGLSFYALLSLAPALWVVVAAAGVFIGEESARSEIVNWTTVNVGARAGSYISGVVADVESGTTLATVAGLISMFFGATLAFGALYDSLNAIWGLNAIGGTWEKGWLRGWLVGEVRLYLLKRALAFVVILLMGVLLLASLVLTSVLTAASRLVPGYVPLPGVLQVANFVISMLLMMILFAVIYRMLHAGSIAWPDVLMGAGVTALLLSLGKTLIGMYLGSESIGKAYGAGGSLLVLLLWVYYSSQIFLFGAEFTEVYAASRRAAATPRPS